MANNLKTNPIGLDAVIAKIQTKLYDKLTALWGVTLEGYPRCYEIKRDKKTTIEHFISASDYVSLIHVDKNKFFFLNKKDYKQNSNRAYDTEVELFFVVNVKECKTSINHRADEEVRLDVMNVLSTIGNIGVDTTISTGIENVFKGYDYRFTDDMQPYHCFKITMSVNDFKLNQTICNGN